jgi:hypothetical protein
VPESDGKREAGDQGGRNICDREHAPEEGVAPDVRRGVTKPRSRDGSAGRLPDVVLHRDGFDSLGHVPLRRRVEVQRLEETPGIID